MQTIISSSGLVPGGIYNIVDGQTGPIIDTEIDIFLTALSANTLTKEGTRMMWVPKIAYRNTIYDPGDTHPVASPCVFGNRVYLNLTGIAGTVISAIALDSTNWQFQTWGTTYYVKKPYFVICHDVETFTNFHVAVQMDEYGNTVNARNFADMFKAGDTLLSLPGFQNTIDVNDWNNIDLKDNITAGIWGNPIINPTTGSITNNICSGVIYGNRHYSQGAAKIYANQATAIYRNIISGDIASNESLGFGIYDNLAGYISNNDSLTINFNSLTDTGGISGNVSNSISSNQITVPGYSISENFVSEISTNQTNGNIANNTGNRISLNLLVNNIEENNAQDIYDNSTSANDISKNNAIRIQSNAIFGPISENVSASITLNSNNGSIERNNCPEITLNTNSGSITYNSVRNRIYNNIGPGVGNITNNDVYSIENNS